MKAKRRHELKENVLAHELGQLREFFSRHGSWIAGAIVAAVIAVVVVSQLHTRSERALAAEKQRYRLLADPPGDMDPEERLKGFEELAADASDRAVAASAAVWAGNLCSQRYLNLLDEADAPEAREAYARAERNYRSVIERHADQPRLVVNAWRGLGVLAENRGDQAEALACYKRVTAMGPADHPAVTDVTGRIEHLEEWFRTRRFPTTRPTTRPSATAPAGGPATAPSE